MQGWLLIGLTIVFEVLGTLSMKFSEGLTRLVPSILIFFFYGICFTTFAIALKKIDLSFAYAVWSGVGTLVISIIGIFFFKETVTLIKICSISLIILGIIGLKFGSGH